MNHEYDSPIKEVKELSAPTPLRSELIAAFNALLRRVVELEERLEDMREANDLWSGR